MEKRWLPLEYSAYYGGTRPIAEVIELVLIKQERALPSLNIDLAYLT
jgi:hypothetical protein